MTFDDFAFTPAIRKGIEAAGYSTPTPIQERSLAATLDGEDLLGLAQTGTGKTAAFVLPILQALLARPGTGTRALVVAPTRELAEQIHGEFQTLGRFTGLRSATVYGGVGKEPQIRALRGRADVIVACPGRLLDHLRSGVGTLRNVEIVVLDEADHMFDMGFLPDVRAIVSAVPRSAQRLLFSATMPSELRHLADEMLVDPVIVEIGRLAPAETVAHALYPTHPERKTQLLKHLLDRREVQAALVFTRTKHGTKRLAGQLDRDGYRVASLQGNLSQTRRQEALDGFRDGGYDVLVATDIAARGIDVSRVSHVINYDVPGTPEAYTHRIGRTGRMMRLGEACTLVTRDDVKQVRAIERTLKMDLPQVHLDAFEPFDLTAALASSGGGTGPRRASGPAGRRGGSHRPGPSEARTGGSGAGSARARRDRGHASGPDADRPQAHRAQASRPQGSRPQGSRPQADDVRADRSRTDRAGTATLEAASGTPKRKRRRRRGGRPGATAVSSGAPGGRPSGRIRDDG